MYWSIVSTDLGTCRRVSKVCLMFWSRAWISTRMVLMTMIIGIMLSRWYDGHSVRSRSVGHKMRGNIIWTMPRWIASILRMALHCLVNKLINVTSFSWLSPTYLKTTMGHKCTGLVVDRDKTREVEYSSSQQAHGPGWSREIAEVLLEALIEANYSIAQSKRQTKIEQHFN